MSPENLQVLFDTHPATNNFFITSDDQAFFTQEMADSHGQKLKDRAVISVNRNMQEPTEEFEAGNLDAGWDETQKNLTPAQKGQITKALNAKKAAEVITEPTVPATEPTVPATEPTVPATEPTAPATEPVEPVTTPITEGESK